MSVHLGLKREHCGICSSIKYTHITPPPCAFSQSQASGLNRTKCVPPTDLHPKLRDADHDGPNSGHTDDYRIKKLVLRLPSFFLTLQLHSKQSGQCLYSRVFQVRYYIQYNERAHVSPSIQIGTKHFKVFG